MKAVQAMDKQMSTERERKVKSLPEWLRVDLPEDGCDLESVLSALEWRPVDQALERMDGNKTWASALLGINRTTLIEKLRARGLLKERAKDWRSK